jgi:hypothetical protein
MKRPLAYALPLWLVIATTPPAMAQTATGVGVAKSSSTSASRATAISGQGGNGTGGQASVTLNSNVPAAQTINNTGTQTIKNVPTVFAPGLAAAGLETCLGSVSAGAGVVGTGATFGTTIPDPSCAARLDARTLWSFGLKKAAVARLCLQPDIYRSMPEVCVSYLPQAAPVSSGFTLFPTSAPLPVAYEQSGVSYRGGPIMLVEGSTGRDRLCIDYDEPGQKCRVWAHTNPHHPKKKTAAPAPSPKPSETDEGKS